MAELSVADGVLSQMRIPFNIVLLVLLCAWPRPCMAEMSIEFVSRERARALGIELKAGANGPKEAWVMLELRPTGPLSDFKHVSLEIRDGQNFQLGWTPLKDERIDDGKVRVRLLANRAFLENVTLRVVRGAMNEFGHDLRVRDFVDLKNLP